MRDTRIQILIGTKQQTSENPHVLNEANVLCYNYTQTAFTWTHHHVAQYLTWVKLSWVQTLKMKLIFFYQASVATINASCIMQRSFHFKHSPLCTIQAVLLNPKGGKTQSTSKKCNCFKHKIYTTLLIFRSLAFPNIEWVFCSSQHCKRRWNIAREKGREMFVQHLRFTLENHFYTRFWL